MSTYNGALPIAIPASDGAPEAFAGEGIGLFESLRIALDALLANKLRTLLTALGVIIGVASVVALLAIGRGTQEQIAERITANGANLLTINSKGAAGGASTRLTVDDAHALADPANVPAASLVSPEFMGIGSVVAGSESKTTMIMGVTPSYLAIHNNRVTGGSFIDESQESANVAVLGARIARDLFGEDVDPVGQT